MYSLVGYSAYLNVRENNYYYGLRYQLQGRRGDFPPPSFFSFSYLVKSYCHLMGLYETSLALGFRNAYMSSADF